MTNEQLLDRPAMMKQPSPPKPASRSAALSARPIWHTTSPSIASNSISESAAAPFCRR